MNLTERMWEISRLEREMDALKRPPRKVIPLAKPTPIHALVPLQNERGIHLTVIRRHKP